MATPKIKLGILTSSRADYGIYKPLLRLLSTDDRFELHIIVFGTHLLEKFGLTINAITEDDFGVIHQVARMPQTDHILDISKGYGEVVMRFSEFWNAHQFDWVLALGDRFEMSAAVQASIPFEVKIAHLHGGETTLGATDNIYRHQISLASTLHFVASATFRERVIQLTGEVEKIYNVGALSLDDINAIKLPSWEDVCVQFNIPDKPFVLVTFHPETVGAEKNKMFASEVFKALEKLSTQIHIVITMSNADAMGSYYRTCSTSLKEKYPNNFSLIENFGRENYFAAMANCSFLLGNTSSGIVEAASFHKYVINVGDRQKGRLQSENCIDVPFDAEKIIDVASKVKGRRTYEGLNNYYQPNTASRIMEILVNE